VLLVNAGNRLSLPAGQVLFRAGEAAESLYVVLAGQLRVYSELPSGDDLDLALVQSGEYVGELAILDRGVRSASVAAVVATELFELQRGTFLGLLKRAPDVLDTLLSNLVQLVRAATDREVRKEAEQRALKTDMELERYRSLARMVAGVAHEVNTPLGTINTAASIIRGRLSGEVFLQLASDPSAQATIRDLQDAAALLMANVTRAHGLIQGFKKLSVSQVADVREPLQIVDVVREIAELFSIDAKRSGLQVSVRNTLADDHPGQWLGYRGALSQVVLNLLANVARYAYPDQPGGNAEVWIEATPRHGRPGYTISVRDWGHGIAPEHLGKIFEPFFTTGRGQGGTGLGLAIVRTIVTDVLGGRVDCVSAPHVGTAMLLWIPECAPDLPDTSAGV
jgi:signal transduction histidine kinase